MARQRLFTKTVLFLCLLGVIALIVWQVKGTDSQAPNHNGTVAHNQPVPVTVEPVVEKDIPLYIQATGTVKAQAVIDVRTQVSGQLLSLTFKEGQPVAKGQLLAQIDDRAYKTALDQAAARMRSDEARLATARSDLTRSQELAKKKYISNQDLITQRNTVKQLEATVATDKAALEAAQIDLDYTQIHAPASGVAGLRQVDVGNIISAGDNLVTLRNITPVNVTFSLPAKDLSIVRRQQQQAPLQVTVFSRNSHRELAVNGTLKVIDNHIDPGSGTFALKAVFPNKEQALWPGQFVKVKVLVQTVKNGQVIPAQAVERGPDGTFAYRVEKDNTVTIVPITVGAEVDTTHVLVEKGLSAGDRIVTEGQFRLKPDSKVTPYKPGENHASSPAGSSTRL